MIDKNLAIGIFPQIMVRPLVIMMARDDILDHTPPLYSLLASFKLINPGPGLIMFNKIFGCNISYTFLC